MRYYNGRSEAWLSLVERRVRDAEAASSNLVASTPLQIICSIKYGLLVKRLRRRPLTAKTGVRFPYRLRKPVNLVFAGFFVMLRADKVDYECRTVSLIQIPTFQTGVRLRFLRISMRRFAAIRARTRPAGSDKGARWRLLARRFPTEASHTPA